MLLWAAENYDVDATGITLSRNQHAYVNRLIEEKRPVGGGCAWSCSTPQLGRRRAVRQDRLGGHVRASDSAQLPGYFAKLRRLVKPGGLVMNHGITAGGVYNAELGNGMGEFIEKYIFRAASFTHISSVLEAVTAGGLEAVDDENLRPHYARTLWAWSDALEACCPRSRASCRESRASVAARLPAVPGRLRDGVRARLDFLHQVLVTTSATGRTDELDMARDLAYPWRRDYIYAGNAR